MLVHAPIQLIAFYPTPRTAVNAFPITHFRGRHHTPSLRVRWIWGRWEGGRGAHRYRAPQKNGYNIRNDCIVTSCLFFGSDQDELA